MKLILLSGGSGKRLWPLSNDSRSKQFLKVLKNSDLQMESMVQRVWNQLKSVHLAESSYIATCKEQVEAIRFHLGAEIPVIIEPERRDTFPAVALSAVYLYSREQVSQQETICIMPVDCFVDKLFYEYILRLEFLLKHSGASLAFIGSQPTYPSQKYGYLVPEASALESDHLGYIPVSRFIEKPDEQTARQLLAEKALWNSGVFAFKLGFILSVLEQNGWPTRYEELCKQYTRLPATSFDYHVAEKTQKIVALPYTGKWKDLGTWNTLTEEMDSLVLGKGIISEDSTGTHLINELDIPVMVLGTTDLVVACSPDGILVAHKADSHRVKQWVPSFSGRPMFEELDWGWYRVLDQSVYATGDQVLVQKLGVRAGHSLSCHSHRKRQKLWNILNGEGQFVLENRISPIVSGNVLIIPPGAKHTLKAITDMELLEVQTSRDLSGTDKNRAFTDWEDIKQ